MEAKSQELQRDFKEEEHDREIVLFDRKALEPVNKRGW